MSSPGAIVWVSVPAIRWNTLTSPTVLTGSDDPFGTVTPAYAPDPRAGAGAGAGAGCAVATAFAPTIAAPATSPDWITTSRLVIVIARLLPWIDAALERGRLGARDREPAQRIDVLPPRVGEVA